MSDEIRVVARDELAEALGTPGLRRQVAFEDDEQYWFGHVEAAPDTMSGWHHHGDNVTLGYVLRGRARLEYGPGGTSSVEIGEGDYFLVPPRMIHREGNPTGESGELVLVRIGQGPRVFPADGPEAG